MNAALPYVNGYVQGCPVTPMVQSLWLRGHGQFAVYTESMTIDLCFLPAIELARLLRNKEISAREVVSAHLGQIERVNPRVNAIVTLVAEQALAEADRLDTIRMR